MEQFAYVGAFVIFKFFVTCAKVVLPSGLFYPITLLRRLGTQMTSPTPFFSSCSCAGKVQPIAYHLVTADNFQLTRSLEIYIRSLTTLSESRLFNGALDLYPGGPGSNPTRVMGFFFSLICYALFSVLRLSCCKMGARPGLYLFYAK